MKIGKMEWLIRTYDLKAWSMRVIKIFNEKIEKQGLYINLSSMNNIRNYIKQFEGSKDELAIFAARVDIAGNCYLCKAELEAETGLLIIFDKKEINDKIKSIIIPRENYSFLKNE